MCVLVHLRWCDSPVAFQPRCVPDLSFDGEVVHLNSPRAELDTNSGTTVMIELILGEARQKVAFPYTRLPYQNN